MNVELVKHSAHDLDVVNAARVSFAQHSEKLTDRDKGLIGFLMREKHGTPFEHSTFTFRVTAPITVFREWHRHRVGHSYNEVSGRYVPLKRQFHYPMPRVQHGKPGRYFFLPDERLRAKLVKPALWLAYNFSYSVYTLLMKLGIAKEVARYCLPGATMSQMYWTCNSRSLMHFLNLRTAPNAMHEIRVLAREAEAHFAEVMPHTYEAFLKNNRVAP
jgi:thymidylate synthase (FAD)